MNGSGLIPSSLLMWWDPNLLFLFHTKMRKVSQSKHGPLLFSAFLILVWNRNKKFGSRNGDVSAFLDFAESMVTNTAPKQRQTDSQFLHNNRKKPSIATTVDKEQEWKRCHSKHLVQVTEATVWLFHGNQYSKKIETFRLLESLPNSLSP
jgi:hypothetical protein